MNISELRVGMKIALGSLGGDDIIWRKLSDDCLFMSNRRIRRIHFDSCEPWSDSRARRSHGNNFYPHSNIHQWLNATGEGWFQKAHEYDESPRYACDPGFLTEFSKSELGVLLPQNIIVAVPLGSRKKYGKTVEMSALVTLPAASQCGHKDPDYSCEGTYIEEIRNLLGRYNACLTRTGIKDAGHVLYAGVDWFDSVYADNSGDIYPIIRVNPDTVVRDTPDGEGVYWLNTTDDDSLDKFLSFISD